MKKFTLFIASLFLAIGAMAQDAVEEIVGVNNIPITRVDLSQGLESGYYLLKQTNSNASAAGGQGVGWIKAASEAADKSVTSKNTGTPGADGATFVWYVEVTDAANNLITISTANKVAAWQAPDKYEKKLVAYDSRATLKYHTSTVNLSGNATPNEGSCFISNEGVTAFVHFSGDYLGSWTDTNSASMFMVEFYKLEEADLIKETIGTITYNVTDVAGNEFTGTYEGIVGTTKPAFTGANGYTLTNEAWNGTNYTATINFAYPVSNKDNGVTNETMFNVKGHNAKLLRVVDEAVKVTNEAADANCLWAIYPAFNNGAFTFTIMNVATGKYIYSEASGSKLDTSGNSYTGADGVFSLSETASVFTYEFNGSYYGFKFADGRSNTFISINSPANDTNVDLGIHNSAHGGTDFVAQSVPAYPVAITEAKYATFYAPVAVTVPAGVTAHTVTLDGEWAVLSESLDVIPAYTGVVLYSETATTYTFAVTTSEPFAGENALVGTVAATYVADDAYVLGVVDEKVGFYTATKNQNAGAAFLNNHHKAYLPKPAGAENIASYSFRFQGGATGIDEITDNRVQSTVIYDLTGRRVENITAPGIYIVNGKKVLVK